jgi:hypothetical protein
VWLNICRNYPLIFYVCRTIILADLLTMWGDVVYHAVQPIGRSSA